MLDKIKTLKAKLEAGLTRGVLAISPIVPPDTGQPGYGKEEFFQLFKNLLGAAIYLGGLVVGIAIIYGGFLVLTSAGNEGRVSQGRKAITSAVVGFAIVLSAWLIVNTLLTIFGCSGAWSVLGGSISCQ